MKLNLKENLPKTSPRYMVEITWNKETHLIYFNHKQTHTFLNLLFKTRELTKY